MSTNRILALDVLRGMTIFLMIVVNNPGSWSHVYAPLLHAEWHGCTPTDLVFPFFLFVVGVSMYVSKSKTSLTDAGWQTKAIIRGLKIMLIGFLLSWFPFYEKQIWDVRVFGVLQRIGFTYLLASIIIRYGAKYLIPITGFILLSYWGILSAYGDLTLEGNLVRKIDLFLIGEKNIYKGFGIPFDPEGLLSSYPSMATILLGYITGQLFKSTSSKLDYIKSMVPYGIIFAFLGIVWHYLGFPLNKPLWTSSYVLWTAGLATLLYALLIYIIDEKNFTKWTYPFKVFGQNPLASFVLSGLIMKIFLRIKFDETNVYNLAYKNFFTHLGSEKFGSLLQALSFVVMIWLVAFFLDRKGWIIKA
jgi:predicted acyltransferase